MKRDGVDDLLLATVTDASLSLDARIAALYAINLRDKTGAVEHLKRVLNNPALCEYALRALLDRDDRRSLGLQKAVSELLSHADPRVRLQAVVGAQRLGLKATAGSLLDLANGKEVRAPLEKDVAHEHNAIPHTARRALILMQPMQALEAGLAEPHRRQAALSVLGQIHSAESVAVLTEALAGATTEVARMEALTALIRLYHREHDWDGNEWWGDASQQCRSLFSGRRLERIRTHCRSLAQSGGGHGQGSPENWSCFNSVVTIWTSLN